MIKMKTDDGVLIIPPNNGIHLIAVNQYTDLLVKCLTSYFGQKKKTICVAVDEENDLISSKDINFVYLPADETIDSWFDFKPKTPMNTEVSEFIRANPEMFFSMECVRNDIKGLLTDSGMYRLKEILSHGTDLNLDIDLLNFDIHSIISSLHLDADQLEPSDKRMIAYNLMLFISRNKYTVVYIDFDVTERVSEWLISNRTDNRLILVNNNRVGSHAANIYDSMIVPSIADHVSTIETSVEQTGLYSYLFHPIVRENIRFQTEKNIDIMSKFNDLNTTFSLIFTPVQLL